MGNGLYLRGIFESQITLTLVPVNPDMPYLANSVDTDQLVSVRPTNQDLHCFLLSMSACINNLDQVI